MQMRAQLLSGATSVAHLIGIGGRTPDAGRPQKPATPPAAGPEQGAEGEETAEAGTAADGSQAAAAQAAPAATAAAPQPGAAAAQPAAAEDEEENGEDDDDEKEDDEKELSGQGRKARARRRERARCRAILDSDAAQNNPAIAMHLALHTALPRQQALAMLAAMPKGAGGLDARMASVPNPRLGPNTGGAQPGQPDSRAIAAGWSHAFAKVSGKRFDAAADAKDTAAGWDAALRRVA